MSDKGMKELSLPEIKELQLEIMDEIDAFCSANGLKYFLAGGTLLGAIRHNGFIPWDDDIDIALPREDYDKLVSSFASSTGNISLISADTKKKYGWTHAKAIHNKTELVENTNKRCKIGVFIDVFPLDKVEGTREDGINKIHRTSRWKNILTLKHLRVDKKRSFAKNAVVICGKLLNLIPDKCLIKQIEMLSKADKNAVNPEYLCNFSGAWGERELVKAEDFSVSVKHKFEDREYCIPAGYDSYLSTVYGDYMTPPPPEKQKSHHDYVAYRK